MARLHARHSRSNLLWLGASLLLLVLIIVTARGAYGMYKNAEGTKEKRLRAEAALAHLEARESTLKSEVERIKTPQGLDEEIRERYGVKKPGEGVIIILDEEEEKTTEEEEKKGFWSSLLNAVGF
jgi:cell division protein FtsB